MTDLEQILDLLDQKRRYLLQYEKEMDDLPLLPTEEMEACMQRGAILIDKIKELDAALDTYIQENEADVQAAIAHTIDRSQLREGLRQLYDASQEVKAIAYRIVNNDTLIRLRVQQEQDTAMDKLKEINTRSSSVAGAYQRSVQAGIRSAAPERQGREG